MAASFKLPSLTRKRRRGFEFPEFSWSSVKVKEELGRRRRSKIIYGLLLCTAGDTKHDNGSSALLTLCFKVIVKDE